MVTTFFWRFLTPNDFLKLLNNGTVVITIILLLFGFTVCYWQMIKSPVSQELVNYMIPAIVSLAGMSIATKEIAMRGFHRLERGHLLSYGRHFCQRHNQRLVVRAQHQTGYKRLLNRFFASCG